jgi:hypothetical protein
MKRRDGKSNRTFGVAIGSIGRMRLRQNVDEKHLACALPTVRPSAVHMRGVIVSA